MWKEKREVRVAEEMGQRKRERGEREERGLISETMRKVDE